MKRGLAFGLAGLLAIGVAIAIFTSVSGGKGSAAPTTPDPSLRPTVVRGVIGSEKKPFFDDPRVQRVFRAHGLDVQVDTAGSRQIATTVDLSPYGFALPGRACRQRRRSIQDHHTRGQFTAFYTPMAIASWKPIADLLVAGGRREGHGRLLHVRRAPSTSTWSRRTRAGRI